MFTHICAHYAQEQKQRPHSVEPARKTRAKRLASSKRSRESSAAKYETSIYNSKNSTLKLSSVSDKQVNRFDFDCFKRFIVRLSKKCLRDYCDPLEAPKHLVEAYFRPLLKIEGRAQRKDIISSLVDFLNSQPLVDFMTVLYGVLCDEIFA